MRRSGRTAGGLLVPVLVLCGCNLIFPFAPPQDAAGDARPIPADLGRELDAPAWDLAVDLLADHGSDSSASDTSAQDLGPAVGVWVKVQAGKLFKGSPTSEPCRYTFEHQHQVTLTRSFEIMVTEVTQALFKVLMGYNPSAKCGSPDCPVEMVSWHEAAAYCNALSVTKGLPSCYACTGSGPSVSCSDAQLYAQEKIYTCPGFRLPTEAEWESAGRAGTTTAYYNGANDPGACDLCAPLDANLDKIAWYCGNAGSTTHPVGMKQANPWGLFDMAGNVYEWCHDWDSLMGTTPLEDPWGGASGLARVCRGGSYAHQPKSLRAAARTNRKPDERYAYVGFRCARSLSLP